MRESFCVVRPLSKALVKAGVPGWGITGPLPADGFVPDCLEFPFIVGRAVQVDPEFTPR